MRVLAIDPSLTCAGFAVLEPAQVTPARQAGADIIAKGLLRIPPAKKGMLTRCLALQNDIHEVIGEHRSDVVVVETPLESTRGMGHKRSHTSGPVYGIAVGVAIIAAHQSGRRVLLTSASEWAKQIGAPASGRDKYKAGRVRAVLWHFGEHHRESMGAETVAGNVADAVLMAWWAIKFGVNQKGTTA